MRRVSLDIAGWTVRAVGDLAAVPASLRGREVGARVPGCVHTELVRAGVIPDPLVGMNEHGAQWVGETDWEYRASFEAGAALLAHERVDLVCDGMDTIAEVRVNGALVGRAANMFHPHRFDIRPAVRAGENEISITFRSPLKHIRAEEERLGKRPVNGDWDPYIFIRKSTCNFGWDWAPKLVTCGIWKLAYIQAWSGVRVERGHAKTARLSGDDWEVQVVLDLEWTPRAPPGLSVSVDLSGHASGPAQATKVLNPGDTHASVVLPARNPRLWSPRGQLGHQQSNLGFVSAELALNNEPMGVVNDWQTPLGFREARLITGPDNVGSRFVLEINGREVFCKGANWIPEGPFPLGRADDDNAEDPTRARLCQRLQQAAAANFNMLRVWGGGSYEDDAFYDLCDELGIMVWQDFMFACAMYPEEEPYPALIEAEARHQVSRLASHPSIVLWCGGNECTWAHDAWGNAPGERPWKERLGGLTWGERYYHELLPRVVEELSPSTPYWPNSPYPGPPSLPPNSAEHGDRHTWDLRGDGYRKIVPRFCSEFGAQSPSNYSTLAAAVGEAGLRVGSPELEHRQRATGGTAKHIDEAMAETFRKPRDFDEWHFLAQLTQARAMKTGIEWMRVNRPRCMGSLVWQFNECWPGMSWSLVDAVGREKLAYHAVKEAFRRRLITIQPLEGRPWLCVVNDDERPARYIMDARRMDFDGNILAHASIEANAAPESATWVADLQAALGEPKDPTREFMIADAARHRATWYYVADRELAYPGTRLRLGAMTRNEMAVGYEVVAETLSRDVAMITDRAPNVPLFGPSLRTLLPGESFHFEVRRDRGAPADAELGAAFISPPVLWCANQFGAGT